MTNREIPDDLAGNRIGIQTAPQIEIPRLGQSESGEKQLDLPNRQLVEVLHIGRIGPATFVLDVGSHKSNRATQAAPVGGFKLPEIFAVLRQDMTDCR